MRTQYHGRPRVDLVQKRLDVVKNRQHTRSVVYRVEPDRTAVNDEHDHIRQDAWTQAPSLVEMDPVPQAAPLPFGMIEVLLDLREAALRPTAAATCRAHN